MITITYRCPCILEEASVEVRNRRNNEDVVEWMKTAVSQALGRDHAARSPTCRSTKTVYVKIPVPENAPFIGAEPKLDG